MEEKIIIRVNRKIEALKSIFLLGLLLVYSILVFSSQDMSLFYKLMALLCAIPYGFLSKRYIERGFLYKTYSFDKASNKMYYGKEIVSDFTKIECICLEKYWQENSTEEYFTLEVRLVDKPSISLKSGSDISIYELGQTLAKLTNKELYLSQR